MLEQKQPNRNEWSDEAEWRALEEQLGSPDEATAISSSAFAASLIDVRTRDQFRAFLVNFKAETLEKTEIPNILRAYKHAKNNELRELVALDRSLKNFFPNEALANASERVGRNQLRRMRALKTERLVTRFWDAVYNKEASGWHTIVFGVVLAVYAIPLRQGLNHYAQQTIRGFLDAGAASLKLRAPEVEELESALLTDAPAMVERALARQFGDNPFRCI